MSILKKLYKHPLFDLGEFENPQFRGIYSPLYKKQEINRFMTSHYESLTSAKSQAKSFDMTNFYYGFINEALKKSGFSKRNQKLIVLDIGCGFGSTTFPLLKLFSKAQIITSELSLSMLAILKEKVINKSDRDRVAFLQLNAEKLDFKAKSFDLVVGAAILHHLYCPEKTIRAVSKILKPGAVAIFFEPFEEGTSMMALIYQTIIYHGGFKWLNFMTKRYFRNMNKVWLKMRNTDKAGDSFFKTVDDKWIFQRKYFFNLAKKYNFGSCQIYRIDKSEKPFTNFVKNHFGKKINSLPRWIFEVVDNYENWLSDELKDELLTEGCIILKKKS